METKDNIKSKILATIKTSIAEIESTLAVSVLDGTPFLLLMEHDGIQMVYGAWADDKGNATGGFKTADLVPDHLCGTIQMDESSARKNAAAISAKGHEKACYMHWRAFLEARLESQRKLQGVLEAQN